MLPKAKAPFVIILQPGQTSGRDKFFHRVFEHRFTIPRVRHGVLAVYTEDDVLILDNQIMDVVPSSAIHHCFPIYSLNKQHWWLHQP